MKIERNQIHQMIDLSAVWPSDDDEAIQALVACARKYRCGLVSTLPAQAHLARELLEGAPGIGLGGNVGFPSGGQTTFVKLAEARELIHMDCTELDVVIHIAGLISGKERQVLDELRAIVAEAGQVPVKVILETHYLTETQIRKGCDLSIEAGAAFVKTSTGWAPTGATLENVKLIKAHVGDAIGIKASGGIRGLETLLELYRRGARRFGIGLRSAEKIFSQSASNMEDIVEIVD
jgi:deoxyribose-phosphate aldolase